MNGVSDDAIRNILEAVKTGGVSILTNTTASGSSVTFQSANGKKIRVPSGREPASPEDVGGEDPARLQVDPAELKPVTF